MGVMLVYSMLFGSGSFIFGDTKTTLVCIAIAIVCIFVIYRNLSEAGWKTVIK
jgi:hypothetical protein